MGWASGSGIAIELWDAIREVIPAKKRKEIARKIIDVFESNDCDTMNEADKLWEDSGREAAYQAGMEAKRNGLHASDCPYEDESAEAEQWGNGYFDAE